MGSDFEKLFECGAGIILAMGTSLDFFVLGASSDGAMSAIGMQAAIGRQAAVAIDIAGLVMTLLLLGPLSGNVGFHLIVIIDRCDKSVALMAA